MNDIPPTVQCPDCGANTAYDRCALCGTATAGTLPFASRRDHSLSGEAVFPAPEVRANVRRGQMEVTVTARRATRIDHGSTQRRRPGRRS